MKKNLCIVGVMALFLCGGTVYAYTQNHVVSNPVVNDTSDNSSTYHRHNQSSYCRYGFSNCDQQAPHTHAANHTGYGRHNGHHSCHRYQ